MWWQQLIFVDYIILAIIVVSAIVGLWRGFLREIISLATWGAAIAIGIIFSEDASAHLEPYVSVPSVRIVLAFGILFVATLFVGGLVNLLVNQIVKATGLSGTDRVVGFVFGIMRGAVLVAILVLAAGLTPLTKDPWWQESQLLAYFEPLAVGLRDLFPPDLLEQFNFPGIDPGLLPKAAPETAPETVQQKS